MIKITDFIKAHQGTIYTNHENTQFTSSEAACRSVVRSIYEDIVKKELKTNNTKFFENTYCIIKNKYAEKIEKLTKRFERELSKQVPDLNHKDQYLIVLHDYVNPVEDKDSFIYDLINNFSWVRGDVTKDTFDYLNHTFEYYYDLDDLNKMFNKGYGMYYFKMEYEPKDDEVCGCGCFHTISYGGWYEFELLKFEEINNEN